MYSNLMVQHIAHLCIHRNGSFSLPQVAEIPELEWIGRFSVWEIVPMRPAIPGSADNITNVGVLVVVLYNDIFSLLMYF